MEVTVSAGFLAKWYVYINPGHAAKVMKLTLH